MLSNTQSLFVAPSHGVRQVNTIKDNNNFNGSKQIRTVDMSLKASNNGWQMTSNGSFGRYGLNKKYSTGQQVPTSKYGQSGNQMKYQELKPMDKNSSQQMSMHYLSGLPQSKPPRGNNHYLSGMDSCDPARLVQFNSVKGHFANASQKRNVRLNAKTMDEPEFEIKTLDANKDVNDQYIQENIFNAEDIKVPGKTLVAEYMKWYFDHNWEARQNEQLDYTSFMEFSYELSEKAAPFLDNCDIDNKEICQAFQKEANLQWRIINDIFDKKTIPQDEVDGLEQSEQAQRINFYVLAYFDYKLQDYKKEDLDFERFMEFAYELSEKAEPFLSICDLDKSDECFDFKTEALDQWAKLVASKRN